MSGGKVSVFVLDFMQKLDQQVSTAGLVAQKGLNICQSNRVDLTTLWCGTAFAFALFPDACVIQRHSSLHITLGGDADTGFCHRANRI